MKILIVDDEKAARYGMRKTLDRKAEVYEAANLTGAREIVANQRPHLILLDLNLGGENGIDLLEELQREQPPPKVIIITAHGSEKVAVEAMKKGAFDYVAKPFDIEELRLIVRNAAEQVELTKEIQALKAELAAVSGYGEIVGTSEEMKRVYALLEKIAETDVTVLITGESGSGKELGARAIHRRGPRAGGELVTVNCAAIPQDLLESELFGHEKGAFTGATQRRIGKFEQAHRGTLFLDEIGDMVLGTQAKILRVLGEKSIQRLGGQGSIEVDVRIISASNKDLKKMVEEGRFREDLYYRLDVVKIHMPALRERKEDIPLLVNHFLDLLLKKHQRKISEITPRALSRLVVYPYPGNVRELRNMIERLVVLNADGVIDEQDLPEEVRFYVPAREVSATGLGLRSFLEMNFKDARQAFETAYLLRKLREHDSNITHTAESIGVHRQSLQQKIKDLGLREFMDE